MSSFTPGPWRIERPIHLRWSGTTGAFLIKASEKIICQHPWSATTGQEAAENEANALLITAAPQMYEALKELITLKDTVKHQDPDDYQSRKPLAWQMAREALAAARGQKEGDAHD